MKPIIALDCDDVLLECNALAVEMLNAETGSNYTINDITKWNGNGGVDARAKYFRDPEFFRRQKAFPGARQFVRALIDRGCDVIFLTAVYEEGTSHRISTLKREFPDVPEKNIMIGSRKDICHVDILVDDAPHNIFDSNAKFPILFRQPWNCHMSGMLSANNYNDVLTIVDRIISGALVRGVSQNPPYVFALVGPSGSGKTAIANELVSVCPEDFAVAQSTTTREKRDSEAEDAYHFIDMNTFLKMKSNGDFLETTMYAGNGYGMERKNVDTLLSSGKNVLVPLDMCGAMAFKHAYGSKCIVCFVKRGKAAIIKAILDRNISNEDKYNRIISLEDEFKNEHLCDITIQNAGTLEDTINQIMRIARKEN